MVHQTGGKSYLLISFCVCFQQAVLASCSNCFFYALIAPILYLFYLFICLFFFWQLISFLYSKNILPFLSTQSQKLNLCNAVRFEARGLVLTLFGFCLQSPFSCSRSRNCCIFPVYENMWEKSDKNRS